MYPSMLRLMSIAITFVSTDTHCESQAFTRNNIDSKLDSKKHVLREHDCTQSLSEVQRESDFLKRQKCSYLNIVVIS